MRLLVVWLSFVLAACESSNADPDVGAVPNPRTSHGGWVSDPSRALGDTALELEQRIATLNRDTGAEIAIAIVPSIGDATPREFATLLFAHWKIGSRARDDGLLVLHVLDQRRVEIETGYGLESALPDVKCKWLIDDAAIPHFRNNDIPAGHAALLRGLDHGVRHPDATRAALLGSARGEAPGAPDSPQKPEKAAKHRTVSELVGPVAWELALGVPLFITSAMARSRAHRSLHRNPKRRPDGPWLLVFLGLLLFGVLVVSAYVFEATEVLWLSTGWLYSLVVLQLTLAVQTFREAFRRHTPRACGACASAMQLLDDNKDDAHLSDGQRAEERVRSLDYWVWKCACGATQIEHYRDSGSAGQCGKCGFHTDQLKREKDVRPAAVGKAGLAEHYYHCAHCKAQRVEQVELPALSPPSRTRSSSSSSGGRSFGGGRSGGGGAGGSY